MPVRKQSTTGNNEVQAIPYWRSYALEAERKMGEMLRETERADGGRPQKTSNPTLPVSDKPTLADLGLTKRDSAGGAPLLPFRAGKRTPQGRRRNGLVIPGVFLRGVRLFDRVC
jgi:hypothetical protein